MSHVPPLFGRRSCSPAPRVRRAFQFSGLPALHVKEELDGESEGEKEKDKFVLRGRLALFSTKSDRESPRIREEYVANSQDFAVSPLNIRANTHRESPVSVPFGVDEDTCPSSLSARSSRSNVRSSPLVTQRNTNGSKDPEIVCCICLDDCAKVRAGRFIRCFQCCNYFHASCLLRWFQSQSRVNKAEIPPSGSCPNCRGLINLDESIEDSRSRHRVRNHNRPPLQSLNFNLAESTRSDERQSPMRLGRRERLRERFYY
ncbi:hypothetical protein CYMTET_40620 [Cymbomonas tetramitiformis]|uniref:RING-type domain-containing protein n=1 Tax=Cymbomonas tetramitiformis TaxID=36881 RepID=A0AAE0C907_9CHLO|nr:hypothetical protein CYMTET_40620 [Cymbomonas tetramitiformis]